MFKITGGKGFHMTFANGWTVSVQFGGGNYGSNYGAEIGPESDRKSGERGSSTAEIAAWDAADNWYEFDSDNSVDGYKSADDVAAFIAEIAAKPAAKSTA